MKFGDTVKTSLISANLWLWYPITNYKIMYSIKVFFAAGKYKQIGFIEMKFPSQFSMWWWALYELYKCRIHQKGHF